MSKDLIDLDNDNALRKLDEMNTSNLSEIKVVERALGSSKRRLGPSIDQIKSSFLIESQRNPHSNIEEEHSFFEDEDNEEKNYNVYENTE